MGVGLKSERDGRGCVVRQTREEGFLKGWCVGMGDEAGASVELMEMIWRNCM